MRSSGDISRRKLLKRAGVGAAVVGAGAMVTASTASAQGSTACIHAGGCGCSGGCIPVGGGSGCCYCFIDSEGCCFAAEDVFCAGLHPCSSEHQCPPGWGCITNTGCGAGVCAPPCGTDSDHNVCGGVASPFAGGATAAGRGGGGGDHHEETPAEAPGHGHG